jgi:hypothetical protein
MLQVGATGIEEEEEVPTRVWRSKFGTGPENVTVS